MLAFVTHTDSMCAMQEHAGQKVIVFMLTCAYVDLYAIALKRLPDASGLSVTALHGRMKQSQRQASLAAFASQPSGGCSHEEHPHQISTGLDLVS